jgi:hypothetical protein
MLEITVFLGVTSYRLVDIYCRFRRISCVNRVCYPTSVEAMFFFEGTPRVRVCNNTKHHTQEDSKEFSYTQKLVTVKNTKI